MKKLLSCTKTVIVLLLATVITLGFYAYMLARPISYDMEYHNVTEYEGSVFEGTLRFSSDGTVFNKNTNFGEELQYRYYYKNGYVFFLMAETDEECEKEIASINDNFDEAVNTPFYADEINSFRMIASEGDGYSTVYTCTSAIIFAAAFGAFALILAGFTVAAFVLGRKSKKQVA